MNELSKRADTFAARLFDMGGVAAAGTPTGGRSQRFYTIGFVIATKILALIFLWAGLLAYLGYEKGYTYMAAENNAASFARALEEHTLGTVRGIDQATLFVKSQYERVGGKLDLGAYAREGLFQGGLYNLIGISDADGWFFMSDRPAPRSNVSDAAHFMAHVGKDSGQLYISRPVLERSSGKWSVQFTRRINTPDGGFGGMVSVSLDPGYFARFYHSIDIGENGVVSLVGTDGILRARNGGGENELGQDLSASPLFAAMKKSGHGSYFSVSAVDGVRRLISFRKLTEYPLIVAVGITETEILKGYIERRHVLLALGGLISLLIVAAGMILAKHTRYQRETEELLRRSERAALSADKSKSEFLANMSHELRTPMHAILSFAELGVARAGDRDKITTYLARIQQSGKRLLSLLNDLLDLSKLEAGCMTFKPAMNPIRPVIDQVVDELSALLHDRRLEIRIGSDGAPATAYFDPAKIAQVLNNLLGNACKFAPAGGVIEISCATDAACNLAISVSDSGPGIPPDEVELIFDQFVQNSKTMTGAGGTGLGLAICRQIVHAYGGRIRADNNPAGGARFSFTLPLTPPQPEIQS